MANCLGTAKGADKIFGQVYGLSTLDTICDHGKGVYLFDKEGKKYIDFSSGPSVVCIGHGDQRVIQAMVEQMKKVSYFHRGSWLNERAGELAERLIKVAPRNMKWCHFTCSGSEANETAIKLAHQYHLEKGDPEKYMIIGRWQSWHGNTLGSLSASGMTSRRRKFGPLVFQWPKIEAPLCYHCLLSISEMGHFLNRTLWHDQAALTSSLRP